MKNYNKYCIYQWKKKFCYNKVFKNLLQRRKVSFIDFCSTLQQSFGQSFKKLTCQWGQGLKKNLGVNVDKGGQTTINHYEFLILLLYIFLYKKDDLIK